LKYAFEQVIFASNRLFRKTPEPVTPSSQAHVAVVLHLFYIDLWHEVDHYLKALTTPYDLFVTVPPHMDEQALITILRDQPECRLYITENRGRDVLPFLLVLDHIGIRNYRYICKLHSKKTGSSPLGNVWRKLLYFDLIGSPRTVEKTLDLFESDSTVGEVTGKYTILDSQRYAYGNNTKIKWLCEQSSIPFPKTYTFSGGTMFWSRTELLIPILTLFQKEILIFEEERGQKDHTLAHAIERFFGIIVQAKGMHIAASPSDYTMLPVQSVEETASLVLGQQYAGQDVYEKINELNDYVHELEALAESMRLKNRLKRLPADLLQFAGSKLGTDHALSDKLLTLYENLLNQIKKTATLLYTLKSNPQVLKKFFYYLKKGEIKYLWTKIKEKSRKNLRDTANMPKIDPDYFFETFHTEKYLLPDTTIDIIIPVYNGYEFLENLFESLRTHTTHSYRLIVVNDASPDERVKPFLHEQLKSFKDAILIDNRNNLGFVLSVSSAVEKTNGHFVILNTDTEVPPFWLERLMYPIFKLPNVASTTPFTNAGTIASFPQFLEDNEIFEGESVTGLDKHFMEVNPDPHYAHLPTGVGFCMGVNYDLIQEIGFFDKKAFGKGYGEENDWCQRAIKHGYANLLVPNLFVYHKHGGSFPSELKQQLLQENHIKLLHRHPDYDKQIQAYIQKDPHKLLRQLLVITASSTQKPLWIMFDHDLGGGANHYANSLREEKHRSGENTLTIRYDYYTDAYKLYYAYKSYTYQFALPTLDAVDKLLERIKISEIFLNSVVSFKHPYNVLEYLEKLVTTQDIILTVPIHDYFPICPSYTLLNHKGQYCHVPDIHTCIHCMKENHLEWKTFFSDHIDMPSWREEWHALLQKSQTILCFSQTSKDILLKAYPDLSQTQIDVMPHTVDDISPLLLPQKTEEHILTIGILGAINEAKGAKIIKDLVASIEDDALPIKVVVIGEITEPIHSECFSVTGAYDRNHLGNLIIQHQIDIFLIPSIWPETFSYTTEEIMKMELPLMVFDLGAPAERVKQYTKGVIIPEISAKAVITTAQALSNTLK
jgi:GT2 family glycosyltransferase